LSPTWKKVEFREKEDDDTSVFPGDNFNPTDDTKPAHLK
jgi:hypothetical protein